MSFRFSTKLLLSVLLGLGCVGEQKAFAIVWQCITRSMVAAPTIVGSIFFHGFGKPIFQQNKAMAAFTGLVAVWSVLGYDEGPYKKEENFALKTLYQNPLLAFAALYAFMYPEIMFDNPELSVALFGHFIYHAGRNYQNMYT